MSIVVEFESPSDYEEDNEDNDPNPYIKISDPDEDIENQLKPDEIVIPMKKIRVVYDYPLTKAVEFEFESDNYKGFTRAHLAKSISNGYKKIYKDEEKDVGKTNNIPGIFNRKKSNGRYGIWGHHIEDLVLRQVTQVKDNLFELVVDS